MPGWMSRNSSGKWNLFHSPSNRDLDRRKLVLNRIAMFQVTRSRLKATPGSTHDLGTNIPPKEYRYKVWSSDILHFLRSSLVKIWCPFLPPKNIFWKVLFLAASVSCFMFVSTLSREWLKGSQPNCNTTWRGWMAWALMKMSIICHPVCPVSRKTPVWGCLVWILSNFLQLIYSALQHISIIMLWTYLYYKVNTSTDKCLIKMAIFRVV